MAFIHAVMLTPLMLGCLSAGTACCSTRCWPAHQGEHVQRLILTQSCAQQCSVQPWATEQSSCHARGDVRRRGAPQAPADTHLLPHLPCPCPLCCAPRWLRTTSIDDGLVQSDAPWCGSRRFGMCYVNKEGRMSTVGTVLEVMVRQGEGMWKGRRQGGTSDKGLLRQLGFTSGAVLELAGSGAWL